MGERLIVPSRSNVEFVRRLRMETAARLLLSNRERTVTEVALDRGFSASAAFARAFRAVVGVSANEYRRRGKAPAGVMSDRNLSTVEGKQGKAAEGEPRYGGGIFDSDRRNEMPTPSMQPIPVEAVTVVDQGELTLAYVRHTGPYAQGARPYRRNPVWRRLEQGLRRPAAPERLPARRRTPLRALPGPRAHGAARRNHRAHLCG